MKRIIPPRTKLPKTILRGIQVRDVLVCAACVVFAMLILLTSITIVVRIMLALFFVLSGLTLCSKYGRENVAGYIWFWWVRGYLISKKHFSADDVEDIMPYYIDKDMIELDDGEEYAAVFHVTDLNLNLLSNVKQEDIISKIALFYKKIKKGALCKVEYPINFNPYIKNYMDLRDQIVKAINNVEKADPTNEQEKSALTRRLEVVNNWLGVYSNINTDEGSLTLKSTELHYVIYGNTPAELQEQMIIAEDLLTQAGLNPSKLDNKELSQFLNYFVYQNKGYFESPNIEVSSDSLKLNGEEFKIASVYGYPILTDGNCWASPLFNIPNTTAVIKFYQKQNEDVVKQLDKTIREVRYRYIDAKNVSGQRGLIYQNEGLEETLKQLQLGREMLINCEFYIKYKPQDKAAVDDVFRKQGLTLSFLRYKQFEGYCSMQPIYTGRSQKNREKQLLPDAQRKFLTETLASAFPYDSVKYMDAQGDYLGDYKYPVMWDIWDIGGDDGKRLNANLFVHGMSGSGKTRTLKTKLLSEIVRGRNVFILDCENEYGYFAEQFNGDVIDMAGGEITINPFQIFSLDDSNELKNRDNENIIATQVTFLSEWFKNLLNLDIDCSSTLMESIMSLYEKKGITSATNIARLKPQDFPTFDDLRALLESKIASEKVKTNEYDYNINRRLNNYLKQFATGGMYAPLWNGATNFTLKKQIVIFNFQTMFANSNTEICNAQMMLVMRLIMQHIIFQREENISRRKEVVRSIALVDEAHRYVSNRFEVAIDTLEQFARRLRKYDSSLWIATQSIVDFIGATENLRSKAQAVIDNCNCQVILNQTGRALDATVSLFKSTNPLTNSELKFIGTASRGQGIMVFHNEKRTPIQIKLLQNQLQYIERPNKNEAEPEAESERQSERIEEPVAMAQTTSPEALEEAQQIVSLDEQVEPAQEATAEAPRTTSQDEKKKKKPIGRKKKNQKKRVN